MAENDLLGKLIPHLDRHLIFPLLQFADEADESAGAYTKAKFELLKHTNMTDFVGDLHAKMEGLSERPPQYAKQREEVLQRRDQLQQETSKITGLLEDSDVVSNLRSDKVANLNYLKEHHGVTVEMVETLYDFANFQYNCGDYGSAAELLYQYRILVGTGLALLKADI
jgi:translation initiation factor 3 subunit E